MLAQNFKSAVDLRISEAQKDSLIKTLVLLETGGMRHSPCDFGYDFDATPTFTGHFNMARWGNISSSCGTVACIGGTAELISGVSFDQIKLENENLRGLFYPISLEPIWHSITPAQAARALRSYLTTGDAKWAEAVA